MELRESGEEQIHLWLHCISGYWILGLEFPGNLIIHIASGSKEDEIVCKITCILGYGVYGKELLTSFPVGGDTPVRRQYV